MSAEITCINDETVSSSGRVTKTPPEPGTVKAFNNNNNNNNYNKKKNAIFQHKSLDNTDFWIDVIVTHDIICTIKSSH